jgi:predicted esterase
MPAEFIHRFLRGTTPMTLLALHGKGGDENDLLPVCRAVAPGASVLSPRGQAVEDGLFKFFSRLGPGVFDPEEIKRRADDLAAWIGTAAAQYGLDAKQIYVLGYSNGANIAVATMLLHPGVIAGGVMLRPRLVIAPETLPDLHGAPVLIAAGGTDSSIPLAEAEALGRLLSAAGAAVDLAVSETGHDLTPQDFNMAQRWFAQCGAGSRPAERKP